MGAQLDRGRNHIESPLGEEILCLIITLKERPTNANSDAQQAMRDAAQGCGVLTVASPVISSGPGDQRTSQDLPFVIRA